MILYTNRMPSRFAGYTIGPLTLIRPTYRNDAALHAHEAVHRAQFWHNPLMGLLYLFSKKARFEYEAAAYREQLKLRPDCLDLYADFLTMKYGLGITHAQARAALQEQTNG